MKNWKGINGNEDEITPNDLEMNEDDDLDDGIDLEAEEEEERRNRVEDKRAMLADSEHNN